jgi:tRNA(Ile)-lysidine synthase
LAVSSALLNQHALEALRAKKNLLAFSGGVDSSALFFLLKEEQIPFDIAIVDYNQRVASKEEVTYALTLAKRYHKVLYHDSITLPNANFEANARKHRYQFFEKIIANKRYDNLLTAHQLNDKLEWFLMQLSKGAGLVELLGFETVTQRKNYRLIRPLIDTHREALLSYLKENNIHYFLDESNRDTHFQRNLIRSHFATPFLEKFHKGVVKSFHYLQKDKESLFDHQPLYNQKALTLLKRNHQEIRSIDRVLKEMGYLLSAAQKEEIEREDSLVISDKIVIAFSESIIFIAPYRRIKMDKKFKEQCRILKIPSKIRPYLYEEKIDPNDLQHFVKAS